MFVGWDWASTTHDVTVVDDAGRIVDRWAAEHTEIGLDQTLARLAGHGRPERLPVAIERPSGLVVDRLLAAGHSVIPIHPNAFHATGPAGVRRGPSLTLVTASSWPTICAPMGTGCAGCGRWMPPPASCRH